jgi:hypothetical protein
MSNNVKAVFAHLDALINGIYLVKQAGYGDRLVVSTPMPRHDVEAAIYDDHRPSPVRWWTLTGGLLGMTFGLLIASLTSIDWPMALPGGKPVVSIPPFVIPMFECMVLWGGLATLLGLIYHARLPSFGLPVELTDPRYSNDKFGIFVQGVDAKGRDELMAILEGVGAIEVSTRGGTEASNA